MSPVLRASPVSTWTRLVRQTQDSNAGQPKSRDVAGDPEVVGHLLGRQAAGDVTGYQPQPGTVLLPGERNPEVLHRRLVGPPNSAPAGGQSCYKRKPSAGSLSMVNPTPPRLSHHPQLAFGVLAGKVRDVQSWPSMVSSWAR